VHVSVRDPNVIVKIKWHDTSFGFLTPPHEDRFNANEWKEMMEENSALIMKPQRRRSKSGLARQVEYNAVMDAVS
jgi:hypothetical protein